MENKLNKIQKEYLERISQTTKLEQLDEIFLELFGKNGEITTFSKEFPKLAIDERKKVVPLFNQVKEELEKAISVKRQTIREEFYKTLDIEELNLDLPRLEASPPPRLPRKGHLHPLTVFEKEIAELFRKIGFSQYDAPHIDSDEYNFQLLNIPEDHPARDLQDTLYIESESRRVGESRLLLRTHTSNAQVRAMKEYKPPFRFMIIDRCFRFEALDARHEHTFDQFEIVYVDKGVSMANLQYLSEYLLQSILGKGIKVRLRPKYYPFVEPGAGVDAQCIFCRGKGCKVCGGVGWLELAGSGMIHPVVLKNGGIDPEKYSGIAWGFSPDRMTMLRYEIEDIRLLRSGDLKLYERIK
jgi:phenylalanyl-tRNA synthetase alpha chain